MSDYEKGFSNFKVEQRLINLRQWWTGTMIFEFLIFYIKIKI